MTTPIGRDFKRTRKPAGVEFELSRDFLHGLLLGLAVAVGVFFWQQHELRQSLDALQNPAQPEPRVDASVASSTSAVAPAEEDSADYGFYDMLPNTEVVVGSPEERPKGTPPPNAPTERPGSYVLQPGAYRDLAEAERLQAKLARLGVSSTIQRVAVDNDEFHRVRVGPINDLNRLDRTRSVLRSADIDALMIRVGD